MHKPFFPLFLLSLVGVLLSSINQHAHAGVHWVGLLAGLVPLAWYHLILRRRPVLSAAEVDSVYYFGFLVTVITLVATAVSIGLADSLPPIRWILLQFGLGLVATGYALFARLQLLSKSASQTETEVAKATLLLARSVEKVAGEMDKAGFQVVALIEQTESRLASMENRTAEHFAAIESAFRQKLADSLSAFDTAQISSQAMTLDRMEKAMDTATRHIAAVAEEGAQAAAGLNALADSSRQASDQLRAASFAMAAQAAARPLFGMVLPAPVNAMAKR